MAQTAEATTAEVKTKTTTTKMQGGQRRWPWPAQGPPRRQARRRQARRRRRRRRRRPPRSQTGDEDDGEDDDGGQEKHNEDDANDPLRPETGGPQRRPFRRRAAPRRGAPTTPRGKRTSPSTRAPGPTECRNCWAMPWRARARNSGAKQNGRAPWGHRLLRVPPHFLHPRRLRSSLQALPRFGPVRVHSKHSSGSTSLSHPAVPPPPSVESAAVAKACWTRCLPGQTARPRPWVCLGGGSLQDIDRGDSPKTRLNKCARGIAFNDMPLLCI